MLIRNELQKYLAALAADIKEYFHHVVLFCALMTEFFQPRTGILYL